MLQSPTEKQKKTSIHSVSWLLEGILNAQTESYIATFDKNVLSVLSFSAVKHVHLLPACHVLY